MTCNGDMVDIVHRGPTNSSIIPLEPKRLDNVHSRPQTGAEPQNGTDVSGNFRLEEGNAHRG